MRIVKNAIVTYVIFNNFPEIDSKIEQNRKMNRQKKMEEVQEKCIRSLFANKERERERGKLENRKEGGSKDRKEGKQGSGKWLLG